MKRYKLNTTIVRERSNYGYAEKFTGHSVMEEAKDGKWVEWEEVEKMREYLENQIPDKRIAKLEKMIGLVHSGKCPVCQEETRGYQAPLGFFAPEAFASLREAGIDPCTGHKFGCCLSGK